MLFDTAGVSMMSNHVQRRPAVCNMAMTILRLPAVRAETGLSRSTIYLRIAQGLWPRPVSLGPRTVGWPASEVAAMNAARIAGRSEVEIRALVVLLESTRKTAALDVAACSAP
jgi:prophage regulatory protein